MDAFLYDLRLAWRGVSRRRAFSAGAIITLALGIGASTAIFSVAYGVSLRPLPYPDGDRLVRLYEANPGERQLEHKVSEAAFDRWRAGATSLIGIALFSEARLRTVVTPDQPRIVTMSVSPSFFEVLGVRPILGSGFKPEREYTRYTTDVVLSHDAWQRLYSGRTDVIGATLTLSGAGDNDDFVVVGVMPPGFAYPSRVDMWSAHIIDPRIVQRLRGWRFDEVIARLKPGVPVAQAQSELEAIAAVMAGETPTTNAGWTVRAESLHDSIVGAFGRAAWLMFAAVGVVLLVACINVGALFAARAVARDRETAVRLSLGAGSARLLRLWITEAGLLCLAGTAMGLLIARSALAVLVASAPAGIPRLDEIALDGAALAVALTAMAATVIVFGVAPLARLGRARVADFLRSPGDRLTEGRHRSAVRAAVIMVQCAGAAALVVLGVMFTRSFLNLTAYDLGWSSNGVVAFHVAPTVPSTIRRPWFARVAWSDAVISALQDEGVARSAAITSQLPFGPATWFETLARGRGKGDADPARWSAIYHKVTDRYFSVMRMRLVDGRVFDERDRFTEPQMTDSSVRPQRGAAIVTEQTARTLWPGESAIGRALWIANDTVAWREVVGVVNDIQFTEVGEAPALHVFIPWTQDSASATVYVLSQTTWESTAATAIGRDRIAAAGTGAFVDAISPLDALVARATAQPRFTSRVVSLFAALALLLASVGIYGTLSYSVGMRVKEIGIRLALGASKRLMFGSIMRGALWPAIIGGVAGLVGAIGVANAFRSLLFGIEPVDAVSVAAGGLMLLAIAAAAALGPALRAARLDPVRCLRAE